MMLFSFFYAIEEILWKNSNKLCNNFGLGNTKLFYGLVRKWLKIPIKIIWNFGLKIRLEKMVDNYIAFSNM
jgi:hypothetical protein